MRTNGNRCVNIESNRRELTTIEIQVAVGNNSDNSECGFVGNSNSDYGLPSYEDCIKANKH